MQQKFAAVSLAVIAGALAACAGQTGPTVPPTGSGIALPAIESDLAVSALMPPHSIGEEFPSAGLGTIHANGWDATVGGFTQTRYSQTLAFPPGTKITIHNLSKTESHTLDVVKEVSGPPALFPDSPQLSIPAHGGNILQTGYASGVIAPGKTVAVTLSKPGTYLIGCAFHYAFGMRDVIVVANGAKPGAQATPPAATTTPSPAPTNSGGGGGGGWIAPGQANGHE